MLNGAQFVEALGRLGFPGASSLKASEFDWLFDCAPENLHFLRFVCRTLNRSNVLTAEEVAAFQELKKSGKPILDESALDEVLKTLGPPEGNGADVPDRFPSSSSAFEFESGLDLEDLETEFQALCREKELKQQRYNRLQVMATSRADVDLKLAAELDGAASDLKEANASIGAENADTNALLQDLMDEVRKLEAFLPQTEAEPNEDLARPSVPPVLLSQLSLDSYLHQEEINTKTLAALTQKNFVEGISDIVEASRSEQFRVLDLSFCQDETKATENDGVEKEERAIDRRRREMARLQWSHIVTQHQLIQARAEEKSVQAALDWLSEKAGHSKNLSTSSSLHSLEDLKAVDAELDTLLNGPVDAACRESARLLNVPIVKGDMALQLARQDFYTSKQDQVRDYLLRQKASFDLILLAQEMEMRRWVTCRQQLRDLSSRLLMKGEDASLRMDSLAEPELSVNPKPNSIISSKDVAFSRLLQMLENDSDPGRSDPFRTFEALNQAAQQLANDLQVARDSLAAATREQQQTAKRLYGDCDALHRAMYTEIQQLVLGPQVRPTAVTDQELLCPNAQELTQKLVEAEAQLQNLQQQMQEILQDTKAKRSQLERNPLLKREKELYIYFHLDAKLLQKIVEDLEKKTAKKGQQ